MKTKIKKKKRTVDRISFKKECHLTLGRYIPSVALLLFGLVIYSVSHAETQRLTDLAALNIQERSITKLQKLVKQYRGSEREPEFLSRLADLYLERSGITFRISEGIKDAQANKAKSSLYMNSLKESDRVLSDLISRYPNYTENAYAHFKRGKAYKELNQIDLAKADYLYLFQHEKNFEMLDSALIDLAEFCADANLHQEALVYLTYISTNLPGSDYYPVAIHKAAWSQFNLANHLQSIELLKTEIDFYFSKIDPKSTAKAEMAFLEGAFNDLALFYFEAINKKADFASIDKAVKLFKKLDRTGKLYGPTVFKFAKLLKAYDLLPELNSLKNKLIADEMSLPETTEVALLIFQYQFDKKNFKGMGPLLEDLKDIRQSSKSPEQKAKIEQTLSQALGELHKLVLKNKQSTEISKLMLPLVSLTDSVSEILGKENSTTILSTFALGETAFAIQNFKLATQKYGDILKPEYASTLEANKLSLQNIALRRISSRYQELKVSKVIPESLQIHLLKDAFTATHGDDAKSIKEWISWVDLQISTLPANVTEADRQSYLTFAMEASKLYYEYFDRAEALNRLTALSIKHSETPEAITAASVVVDTLLKNQSWSALYDITQKFLAIPGWTDKTFVQKVKDMSADSHFRITMATTDPVQLKARTTECKEKFKGTTVATECSMIEAKLELNIGNLERAETDLTSLLKELKEPGKIQSVLLLRVDAYNRLGKFDQAIHDLNQYQTMTDFKDPEMTQSILQHYWFKHQYRELDEMTQNKKVCAGKTAEICERYRVIRILSQNTGKKAKFSEKETYRNAVHGPKSMAAVWALEALSDPKKIPFQDRLIYVQRIAATWEELNPLVQIHLLPLLQERIADTLESIRVSAPGIAPLTSDASTIERRMRLTQDVDSTFAKAMKLPWLEIKTKAAGELAVFYQRLIQDLRSINTPENLLKPFVQKISETQQAVVQLQEMAKDYHSGVLSDGELNQAAAEKAVTASRKPASAALTVESVLLSDGIKKIVLPTFRNEWSQGVSEKRCDYLFYLVGQMETVDSHFKTVSPILKGMILLLSNAPSEAYELIKSAPDQPLKAQLLIQFESRRISKAEGQEQGRNQI